MEGITLNIILEIAEIAILMFFSFIAGVLVMKKRSDGTIIIEPTEEDDGERLIWKLDLELDDIKKRDRIVFKVENNTSQKSQSV